VKVWKQSNKTDIINAIFKYGIIFKVLLIILSLPEKRILCWGYKACVIITRGQD